VDPRPGSVASRTRRGPPLCLALRRERRRGTTNLP
jgi:hypothetical protein